MQCFRLMGMPDKVIAFDELPEKLLQGFEMITADGFPRHWKEWLGKKKRTIKIPPEKDLLTGQVRYYDPILEEDSYFYVVDWNLNPVVEKWKEVCDYVRQNIPKDVRLMDKLEDMALPLAANKMDGVTLEPEDVVVIPLPKAIAPIITAAEKQAAAPTDIYSCEEKDCNKAFDSKQGLRFHKTKKHSEKKELAAKA